VRRVARSWLVVLLVVLSLLAAACGGDDDDNTKAGGSSTETTAKSGGTDAAGKGKKVGLVYDIGGRGDKSFNDSAAEGLDKAKSELGIDAKDLSPAAGGENREELLRLVAQSGYQLNFAVGFASTDALKKVAGEFPNLKFAIIDAVVDLPNVASLTFTEEQGSYLVGAAAALKSTSNHIGFIGGVDTDLIKKFEAGYVAGAKKIKPDIKIDVKYITQPPDFSGFNDPAKGKEIAAAMYASGADVVYHAAGGSGTGLFEAAKAASTPSAKQWAIGVDGDQHESADPTVRDYILTSMLKKVSVAVYDTIDKFVKGDFKAGNTVYSLKDGGIDYATSGGFVDDIKGQLDDLKKQIIDGTIKVPTTP
jgi:basic membrane protein A